MQHHRAEKFDNVQHAMELHFGNGLIDRPPIHAGSLAQAREMEKKSGWATSGLRIVKLATLLSSHTSWAFDNPAMDALLRVYKQRYLLEGLRLA